MARVKRAVNAAKKRRTTLDYQQVEARTGTDKKEGIFYGVW